MRKNGVGTVNIPLMLWLARCPHRRIEDKENPASSAGMITLTVIDGLAPAISKITF